MFKFFNSVLKTFMVPFKKEFWCEPFPEHYAPECFDCHKTNCKGCEFVNK